MTKARPPLPDQWEDMGIDFKISFWDQSLAWQIECALAGVMAGLISAGKAYEILEYLQVVIPSEEQPPCQVKKLLRGLQCGYTLEETKRSLCALGIDLDAIIQERSA